jgi:hypothetical protein
VGEVRYTIFDLAKMFDLDTFVVQRIAQSEKIYIPHGYSAWGYIFESKHEADLAAVPEVIDSDARTEPIDVDENAKTGVYSRKKDGTWVRVR